MKQAARRERLLDRLLFLGVAVVAYLVAGVMFVAFNIEMGGAELCPAPDRPAYTLRAVALAPLAAFVPIADCVPRATR